MNKLMESSVMILSKNEMVTRAIKNLRLELRVANFWAIMKIPNRVYVMIAMMREIPEPMLESIPMFPFTTYFHIYLMPRL